MTADKKSGGQKDTATASARKPWVKKSPVEIFLDQIAKQENRVAELEKELARERRELEKMQSAKKILEAK